MLKRKMKVPLGDEGDVPRLEWSNQNPDAVWLKNCDGDTAVVADCDVLAEEDAPSGRWGVR